MSTSPIQLKLVGPDREFYLATEAGKPHFKRYRREQSLLKVSDDPVYHVHAPAGQILAINDKDRTVHLFPADTLVYD